MALTDADVEAQLASLLVNQRSHAERIHYLEELVDTYMHSPLWKRILFSIDGWPADRIASQPSPRPWHRWTRR